MGKDDRNSHATTREFNALSLLWRFAFALVLVLVTYNPSGFSVFHWIRDAAAEGGVGPAHFFVAAILAIGWTILLVATWRALDTFGVVLAAIAIGTFVWLLVDFGVLGADSATSIAWISLVCLSVLLAIGLSWSHIWRRLTGQFNVDETND
ncbi:MAG: DUF6524 family protein [Gammaproteobacteria bacterium]